MSSNVNGIKLRGPLRLKVKMREVTRFNVKFREVYYACEPSPGGGGGGTTSFEIDETLTFKDGVLSVNTADVVEEDNTLPVTSAAVATQVGNIEILLKTI